MNMMCSNRCANPVRPVSSSLDPTWYQVLTVTSGREWSSWTSTLRPLGSVNVVYGMRMEDAPSAGTERQATSAAAAMGEYRFVNDVMNSSRDRERRAWAGPTSPGGRSEHDAARALPPQ